METKTHFRLLDPQINYLLYPQTRILFDDESLLDLYMSRTFGKLDVLKDQKHEWYDDEDDIDDIDDTNVVEPKHYTESGIETIDVIDAYTKGIPGPESFYVGNILKYVMRAPKKNGAEDYEKAFWYLTRLIGVERANQLMNDIYANRNEDDQKKGEN